MARQHYFNGNDEMLAFGASNVAAGLTGGFVLGVSASRTAAMWDLGVRSQIPGLVGSHGPWVTLAGLIPASTF